MTGALLVAGYILGWLVASVAVQGTMHDRRDDGFERFTSSALAGIIGVFSRREAFDDRAADRELTRRERAARIAQLERELGIGEPTA